MTILGSRVGFTDARRWKSHFCGRSNKHVHEFLVCNYESTTSLPALNNGIPVASYITITTTITTKTSDLTCHKTESFEDTVQDTCMLKTCDDSLDL